MEERCVTEKKIEYAIQNPAVILPGKQPGTRLIYLYTSDGRRLGVVYKPKKDGREILVITVYWS